MRQRMYESPAIFVESLPCSRFICSFQRIATAIDRDCGLVMLDGMHLSFSPASPCWTSDEFATKNALYSSARLLSWTMVDFSPVYSRSTGVFSSLFIFIDIHWLFGMGLHLLDFLLLYSGSNFGRRQRSVVSGSMGWNCLSHTIGVVSCLLNVCRSAIYAC